MDNNFEVPEINVTPFSARDNAGGSNELPFLPFSSRGNDLEILDF